MRITRKQDSEIHAIIYEFKTGKREVGSTQIGIATTHDPEDMNNFIDARFATNRVLAELGIELGVYEETE